jgi:hypothetical protein
MDSNFEDERLIEYLSFTIDDISMDDLNTWFTDSIDNIQPSCDFNDNTRYTREDSPGTEMGDDIQAIYQDHYLDRKREEYHQDTGRENDDDYPDMGPIFVLDRNSSWVGNVLSLFMVIGLCVFGCYQWVRMWRTFLYGL